MPIKPRSTYVSYTPELIAELKALVKPLTRPEGVKAVGERLGLSERQARRTYAERIEGPIKPLGSLTEFERSLANPKTRVVGGLTTPEIFRALKERFESMPGRPIRRLFYDIETSPNVVLAWKTGYKLTITPESILKERAVISIGYKWAGEKETHVLHWDENQNDKAMLAEFIKVFEQCDEAVGHNLSRFDMPWVRTRCLFHGLPPLPDRKEIDTLRWARSKFYFNSNKLDYIAKFLGLGGKIKTEFGLWKDVVLNKCPKAMEKMCTYCKYDVILLEKVWARLAEIMPVKTNVAVLQGGERWQDPRTGSTDVHLSKTIVSAAGVTKYQMKSRTGSYHTISQTAFDAYRAAKGL